MDRNSLFTFYEKIYFHEMETREKLFTRIQISFALFFTGYSIVSYMVRVLDFAIYKDIAIAFVVLTIISIILSLIGVKCLVVAFWGSEYQGMASPVEIDEYRKKIGIYASEIADYNESYPGNKQELVNVEGMVQQFLYEQLRDCSTHNTKVNDARFAHTHNSIRWLLVAAIPFFIASVLFISFDLDASSPRKESLIHNRSLVDKVDKLNSNIGRFLSDSQNQKEVQRECFQYQKQVTCHLHQMLQHHQSQEKSLKTVNHLKDKEVTSNDEHENATATAATK